ncbi:hypothetical protein QBC33DRAFT_518868 [Phialemonium atrogriseum]|uniref:Uncharacterized protein n=1 Tax=Phialemonium atrogriseum TaxID=1093897 RepID=A0AAJ0BSK5_9PEZI|nr:uncharacterized protein QBC33DRAFT_518868 [Phialemonium atrogriseum]KAK1763277.1 hypothetical protein QBC33DRAFT_518868 [Phialemonium atrogriseum]
MPDASEPADPSVLDAAVVLDKVVSFWATGLDAARAGSFFKCRLALSQACQPRIAETEHPNTVWALLEMVMEYLRAGWDDLVAVVLRHVAKAAPSHHPLVVLCRRILLVEAGAHIWQMLFDQGLVDKVEKVAPYSTNKNLITTNARDLEDGILAWATFAVDTSQDHEAQCGAELGEDGGKMCSGGGNFGIPGGSFPPVRPGGFHYSEAAIDFGRNRMFGEDLAMN